jgi:hypothetical protein
LNVQSKTICCCCPGSDRSRMTGTCSRDSR